MGKDEKKPRFEKVDEKNRKKLIDRVKKADKKKTNVIKGVNLGKETSRKLIDETVYPVEDD